MSAEFLHNLPPTASCFPQQQQQQLRNSSYNRGKRYAVNNFPNPPSFGPNPFRYGARSERPESSRESSPRSSVSDHSVHADLLCDICFLSSLPPLVSVGHAKHKGGNAKNAAEAHTPLDERTVDEILIAYWARQPGCIMPRPSIQRSIKSRYQICFNVVQAPVNTIYAALVSRYALVCTLVQEHFARCCSSLSACYQNVEMFWGNFLSDNVLPWVLWAWSVSVRVFVIWCLVCVAGIVG